MSSKKKQITAGKVLFFSMSLLMMAGIFFYSFKTVRQASSQYTAGIEAVSKLSVLSQSIVKQADHSLKVSAKVSSTAFNHPYLPRLKELVRRMELRHLSLFRGNPTFAVDRYHSAKIKSIYYEEPTNAGSKVREFLQNAHSFINTAPGKTSERKMHFYAMKSAANGHLVQAISQVMHKFRLEYENEIIKITVLLIVGVIAVVAGGVFGYLYLFPPYQPNPGKRIRKYRHNSVSPVIRNLSIAPDK